MKKLFFKTGLLFLTFFVTIESNAQFTVSGTSLASTGTQTVWARAKALIGTDATINGNLIMGGTSYVQSPTLKLLASPNLNPDSITNGTMLTLSSTGAVLSNGSSINFKIVTGATGFVQIGSVIPKNVAGYKLFVDQGILTEKVKVAVAGTANWSDYVFAKDYKLMPLSEVANFVKINKHLPNVPSANEMVKNGNDLGATDAKLLEKIEELTLYLIDIKKVIDSQNEKIIILENKLK